MRKIGFTHLRSQVKEILPKSYQIESLAKKRKMLIVMINDFLDAQAKICTKDPAIFQEDILCIFLRKIESFFPLYKLQPQAAQRVTKIYTQESILFDQFFKMSKNKKFHYLSRNHIFTNEFKPNKEYKHPAAQLINIIFNGKEIEMMMDLNALFANTVYKRIKREPNKTITHEPPYIHINQHGVTTRLYPQWKTLNPNNLKRRGKDINSGLKAMGEDGIDQCYLVYPKTQNFQRHIRVKHQKEMRELKLIPYSFTFCNRK